MQVVSPELIRNKKVLLRLDLDVSIHDGRVVEDFRLRAGLPTLKLCLEYAKEIIVMGHIGRPNGREVPELSVEPIYDWLRKELGELGGLGVEGGKLKILENLRFESGESFDTAQDETAVSEYAKELAKLGNFYINEAFAAHHPAASTIILPTLFPDVEDPEGHLCHRRAAGLRFVKEVEMLTGVRENPKRPLVVIIGGAKLEDKLPAVEAMAKIADYVLVGGKIVAELSARGPVASVSQVRPRPSTSLRTAVDARDLSFASPLAENVLLAELNEEGIDITAETLEAWKEKIKEAKMIVWNGPMGVIEDPKNDQTKRLAEMVTSSEAETIVGGGDTVGFLGKLGMLEKFGFISTGGGAMLELLTKGTLPTIEALS